VLLIKLKLISIFVLSIGPFSTPRPDPTWSESPNPRDFNLDKYDKAYLESANVIEEGKALLNELHPGDSIMGDETDHMKRSANEALGYDGLDV